MRHSVGGATKSISFSSTISPPMKSSTNSSLKKKQSHSPHRDQVVDLYNSFNDQQNSIKIPVKRESFTNVKQFTAGNFTHREKGNSKEKKASGTKFILCPLSCEHSDGSNSENFYQVQKQHTQAVISPCATNAPNIFDDSNSSPRGEIGDHSGSTYQMYNL